MDSIVIIALDNNTRVRGTEHGWQLEREHITRGETRWKAFSYHTTFVRAIRSAYRHEIRTHHAEGLVDCVAAAEQLLAKYKTVLDEFQQGETT